MSETEINEILLPLAGFERCGCGYPKCKHWSKAGKSVESDSPDAIDETALRQVLGKLSDCQVSKLLEKLFAIYHAMPKISDGPHYAKWLLIDCPTATKARVLAEMVKGEKV